MPELQVDDDFAIVVDYSEREKAKGFWIYHDLEIVAVKVLNRNVESIQIDLNGDDISNMLDEHFDYRSDDEI